MPNRVALGGVQGVFGVHGWLKVRSYTRPESNLLRYPTWYLAGKAHGEFELREGRPHGRSFIVHLARSGDGSPIDREQALTLIGARIEVERSALPEPPAGEYYWADLIGLTVESLQGETLGVVDGLTDNGAQDVLVVADRLQSRLIPFVNGPIVKGVDLKGGRILVDWAPDY